MKTLLTEAQEEQTDSLRDMRWQREAVSKIVLDSEATHFWAHFPTRDPQR